MRKEDIVLSTGLKSKPKNKGCAWQSGWVYDKVKTRNIKRIEEDREGKNAEITREEKMKNTETEKKQERAIMFKIMEIYFCKPIEGR